MIEIDLYKDIQIAMFSLAIIVFIALFKIPAGYGKMVSRKWLKFGAVNNKLGWFIMEVPTMVYILFYFMGDRNKGLVGTIFLLVWLTHYVHRTFIFPFMLRGKNKMPVLIIIMGMLFNLANVYIQGKWLYMLAPPEMYTDDWVKTPQFIAGIVIFFFGFYTNIRSDYIIRHLRKDPNDTNHYIPYGYLFKYVSCPNYLGEMVEWLGWCIMTFSTAGLVFFIWTFANLAPRAISTHKWYLNKFGEEYEKLGRKAFIPFIW